ncbi:MAG TPA: hypothetical protein VHC68_02610 [Candidatus Paceibacterota bacterium]|nr:hypothetical protein [Candidatus Paceibacterota bacterium]
MPIHPGDPPTPQGQDDSSALEDARERLYSPRAVEVKLRRALEESGAANLPHAWAARIAPKAHPHVRLALLFLIGAAGFFVIAGGLAALLLFTGSTSVSTANITVAIQGPTTIAAGDTVPLSLAITNKNVVPLENATLEVDFPPGTRSASDESQSYPRYVENLGTLAPGVTVLRSVKAVVFGSSGSALSIPLSLSYEAQGSNATFVKKSSYPLSVTSAPLSLSVDLPPEAVAGQPFTATLLVRSNATTQLDDVVLAGQFPFTFTLQSSSPTMSGASFLLGTLAPGATRTVQFTGTLAGQAGDQDTFHFMVGTGKNASDPTPEITYMTQDATAAIAAPFLATALSINGDTSASPTLAPGAHNTATLTWKNTLDVPLTGATISVALSGAVAPGSISSGNGFYDSSSGSIVFSPSTDASLGSLAPGASGIGSFSFDTAAAGGARAPSVTFTVSISGERAGQDNLPEQVTASQVETAAVAGSVSLVTETLHASGPIPNSGPLPPAPGAATTYTVLWQLTNPGNDIANPQVVATLPSYVSYTGQTSGAGLSYDDAAHTVTWKPGDLASGGTAAAAFQLSFTPSTSQAGSAPPLTSAASFTGFDRYAQVPISAQADPATTETADPGATLEQADVQ